MIRYGGKLRLLGALNLFLALAIAGGLYVSAASRSERAARGSILEASADAVAGVEISRASETLVFRRTGGAWTMESGNRAFPARSERVEAFLEAVQAVRSLREAGRSEAAWAALGLDDAAARRVRLLGGKGETLADFRLGLYAPEGSLIYARKEGGTRSYAIDSAAAARLPSSSTAWLDLRLFGEPVPLEDVQRLKITGRLKYGPGETYQADFTLTRSAEKGWASAEIPRLDPSAAERFVRSVLYLEGEDYAEESRIAGNPDGLRIDLELGGGTQRTLWISPEPGEDGVFRASRTGTGLVLKTASWTLKDALKTSGELEYK